MKTVPLDTMTKPPGLNDDFARAVLPGFAGDNEEGLQSWDQHVGRAEQLASPLLKPHLALNTLD